MNFKRFIIKVILWIYATSAEKFNLNNLNTANKSLDTLNQSEITLNITKDYHNDVKDNQFNDNHIIDNNDDTISKFKLQQPTELLKRKLNSLLKANITTTIQKILINKLTKTTKQTSFENDNHDEKVSEPKIYLQRLPLNFNISQNTLNYNDDNVEANKTNHHNEFSSDDEQQLENGKLKTGYKGLKHDKGKEKSIEKWVPTATATTTAFNCQSDLQDDENNGWEGLRVAREKITDSLKGKYQMKYYTATMSSAFLFGQLPQLQLQPQQLQLYLQQQQQQQQQQEVETLLPPEYHHLSDYRFLFNPERDTEFFLHTLKKTQIRNYAETAVGTTTEDTFLANKNSLEPEENIMLSSTTSESSNKKLEDDKQNPDDNVMVNSTNARVLNIVANTIGSVFGVKTRPVAGIQDIQTEKIELYNGLSLRQSRFNPFNPCRIIIHGWLGGSKAGIYNTIVPEYLKLNDSSYNIITVDWGRGALADYITASYRVKPVGMVVAKFIDFLHRESGLPFGNIHVIGFSMGAHIAGIGGKFVQSGRLPVIYGLDPALPLFRYENSNERLDARDADYVEIIHTSAGSYGYDHPLGHVDFYVNYGYNQPGCFFNECSHFRAFQIYAEILRNEILKGTECLAELWLDMIKHKKCRKETGQSLNIGVEALSTTQMAQRRGLYFVNTNAQPPYRII